MAKEILYTTAIDESGNLIRINNAVKGRTYYCPNPECNGEFILRKSGKISKGSKRPHFAHKNLTTNCTPEGVLHISFKRLLISLLESYISENRALIINWNCYACFIGFTKTSLKANLLEKTATIKEEYDLKVCQPDIALLDAEGKVMAVIEIVVTHKPEEDVLQYYKKNGIPLIQIELFSEEDLDRVEEKITCPDVVNFCLNPECLNFKNYTSERKLIIADKRCKRCGHPMRTCHVEANSGFGTIIITALNENEMKLAQSKGVRFNLREDKTTKKKQTVISCLNCEIIDKRMRSNYERMKSRYRRHRL